MLRGNRFSLSVFLPVFLRGGKTGSRENSLSDVALTLMGPPFAPFHGRSVMLCGNRFCLSVFLPVFLLAIGFVSTGRSDTTTIASWTFDGAGSAFLADSSGKGNALTNYGATQSRHDRVWHGKQRLPHWLRWFWHDKRAQLVILPAVEDHLVTTSPRKRRQHRL